MGATKENTGGSSNGENAWADSIETDETASRKEMPARVYLGERAEKYGHLLLEKNDEEKSAQAQSENRIDLLILNQTNRANRQRKLTTNSSSQLRSEHE
jgi:hypothetical protein